MCLLFKTLPRFVVAFLSRRSVSNFMAAVTVHSDSGAQENKVCHCFHCLPIYLPWSDGTRCHEISFLKMSSFKPAFLLSSFTFIKRLFSSSSLSAIRVVSSTYLKLLIFPLAVLIPAFDSSSLAFHIMYSTYKLNKQGTIYSPEVLLCQLGTSVLFHVWF